MRYRRAEHHPDGDYASLLDHVIARFGGAGLLIVWNGDVLDFDAPWVKDGASSDDEFPLDDAGTGAQAARILADHPRWIAATARAIRAGAELVVMSGNHDLEIHFEGVRRAIRDAIAASAAMGAEEIAARVSFRRWFHVTGDRIYIEHGSQYDVFNNVPWPMLPVTRSRTWMHPVTGKLAFKRTGSRMGYFNPYYEETFYMGLFGYLGHFLSRYAFTKRSIMRPWFFGSTRTALEILRHRNTEDWSAENRARAMEETGATSAAVDATQALRARPAEATMLPVLRELWLDRFLLALLVIAVVTIAGLAKGLVGALVALVALAVLFVIYEVVTPKPDIRSYDSAPPEILALYDIHGARALCLGHTHRPRAEWTSEGRFLGNSGAWCPAFKDDACEVPVLDRRPFLLLESEQGELSGGLYFWDGRAMTEGEGTIPLRSTNDRGGDRDEVGGRVDVQVVARAIDRVDGDLAEGVEVIEPRPIRSVDRKGPPAHDDLA